MDPFSALAIACAVVAFVDFGSKVAVTTRKALAKAAQKETEALQAELEKAIASLSLFIDRVHEVSEDCNKATATASPGQRQLLQACAECDGIVVEFLEVLSKIKSRRDSRPAGRTFLGKAKDVDAVEQVNVDGLQKRLEQLRRNVIDTIILCIW